MRKRRGFVPGSMARLEERVVLSPGLAAEIGPSVAVMPRVRLDLRGTISGVESRELRAPIVYRLRLSGRGEVAPLGQVQASGTLTIGTRTIWRPGEPTIYDGQLTLAASQGNVFVHIYSTDIYSTVRGPSRPHSVHLRYDITGGTGRYRGATGHGAVAYDHRTPPEPEPLPFPPGPGRPYPQVMFTLKFGDVRGLEA